MAQNAAQTREPSPYKGTLSTVALSVFGVLLALLIGAALLNLPPIRERLLLALHRCDPAPASLVDAFQAAALPADSPVTLTPCAAFINREAPDAEFRSVIRYNRFGFHDDDHAFARTPKVPRLLFIGDSYLQANEVPLERGFAHQLEAALGQARGGPVEVVNLGLQTLNLGGSLGGYAALGWRFDADLLVLFYYVGNDLFDDTLAYPLWVQADDGALIANVGAEAVLPAAIQDADAPAPRWYAEAFQRGQSSPLTPKQPVVRDVFRAELGLYLPPTPTWESGWALTEALLRQFRDLSAAQGSRLLVVVLPDRRAVDAHFRHVTYRLFPEEAPLLDFYKPYARLHTILSALDIPTLDLQPALERWQGDHPQQALYFLQDGHFTPTGHDLVTQLLTDWLAAHLWEAAP